MTERPRIRRVRPWPVIAGALAVFFTVLVLLAYQTRTAHLDAPAARLAVAAAPPPRQVVLRRVIVTRVVTELREDEAPPRAPIEIVSAPASSGPATAPPAIPAAPVAVAPAPAPLTTHTS
jgi:hypothetical protein